jgi:hypothetical protein
MIDMSNVRYTSTKIKALMTLILVNYGVIFNLVCIEIDHRFEMFHTTHFLVL